MTTKDAKIIGIEKLKTIYEEGEAEAILNLVLENIIKTKKNYETTKKFTDEQQKRFEEILNQLLTSTPVQYVLHEAWFFGLKFYVDNNVLIPRQETEELVDWIITDCRFPVDELKILDIGTGSGCIPISLKRKIKKAEVWACDISEQALSVAIKNATNLGAEINFKQLDFLDKTAWNSFPRFDIIVSNPPYVPETDKAQLNANVLHFEPATALFVPDNNPLLFYEAIALFGKEHLTKKGFIYTELHEKNSKETVSLFQEHGYATELRKDMQQKDRMLKSGLI